MATTVETVKYLTEQEIDALLENINDVRDRAIVMLALEHGLRAAEVGLLQVEECQFGKGVQGDTLFLKRLKGSKSGQVALSYKVGAAIRQWIKIRGSAPGPLFLSRHRRAIARATVNSLIKRYCAAAGIPREKANCRALKHTCAMRTFIKSGGSIIEVQQQLGFTALESTNVYAQIAAQANESEPENAPIPKPAKRHIIPKGHVYFVETLDGQFIKIGYSTRPKRRFSEFGTLRPGPFALRLIGSFPGSLKTERWLHEKFQEDRDNGEWFRASDRLREFIATVIT